jgi:hypothetical protein
LWWWYPILDTRYSAIQYLYQDGIMSKHLFIVDSFHADDTLLMIYKRHFKHLTITVRPDTDEILYMDTPEMRIIAADNWQIGRNRRMTPAQLSNFVYENGPDHSYNSPSSFAISLFRSMHTSKFDMALDGYKSRLCYESIYGGRCEVIRFGMFQTHEYDINSSYPYAAVIQKFPDPRKLRYCRGAIENIWRYEGVSRVTFSQGGWLPVLPVRVGQRTYFAECNHAVGTYTHAELRYAIENGVTIHHIHKQYYAPGTLSPFTDFVRYCFKRRNETGNKVWKIVACALFGRLSVRPGQLLRMKPAKHESDFHGVPEDRQRKYGLWCVGDYLPMQRGSNPLWAAMVLSEARARLHRIAFDQATIYLDTDCVFRQSPLDVPISEELGQYKYHHGRYEIKGAKLYRTDRSGEIELVMKGIATKHRTERDFTRARMTQERFQLWDGSTRPYVYDNGVLW